MEPDNWWVNEIWGVNGNIIETLLDDRALHELSNRVELTQVSELAKVENLILGVNNIFGQVKITLDCVFFVIDICALELHYSKGWLSRTNVEVDLLVDGPGIYLDISNIFF